MPGDTSQLGVVSELHPVLHRKWKDASFTEVRPVKLRVSSSMEVMGEHLKWRIAYIAGGHKHTVVVLRQLATVYRDRSKMRVAQQDSLMTDMVFYFK